MWHAWGLSLGPTIADSLRERLRRPEYLRTIGLASLGDFRGPLGLLTHGGRKGKAMHDKQRVSEMASEVLTRQAELRAELTGEPFEDALIVVQKTDAGRQLEELRDGPHRDERAERWQPNLTRVRAKERSLARRQEQELERERKRAEERDRARRDDAWERFMRSERRGLEMRKDGQLAELLGEALPGESQAALQHLASEDRKQAEEGLVSLLSGGNVSYKRLDELLPEDVPARAAAERSRTAWLKKRREERLGKVR